MDIKMPSMDGLEATEIISKRFPNTKVIALSMHDDEKNIFEMISKGAVGYLIKNADKEEVEKAIREVMIGRPYFSNQVSQILFEQITHKMQPSPSNEILKNDRYREIMFLIGHEFNREEIADAVCLSPRTVENYRRQIIEQTQSKSIVGLVKYIIEKGLLQDAVLKKKFAKILAKKN
jgi:DNA-binding NarL/FixJ family response regulator